MNNKSTQKSHCPLIPTDVFSQYKPKSGLLIGWFSIVYI